VTRREERTAVAVVAAVAAAAWLALLRLPALPMEGVVAPAGFLGGWTVMMAAMMLPSAAPLVRLYAATAARTTPALVAGYLLVWAAVGVPAYVADVAFGPSATIAGAVLVAAGVYQLSPLKHACLSRCRTPLGFMVARWRRGTGGALRLGAEHGAYCVGCCWGLMAVLVVAGSMGLAWAALIATSVAAEKLLPWGATWARVSGAALAAGGVAVWVVG